MSSSYANLSTIETLFYFIFTFFILIFVFYGATAPLNLRGSLKKCNIFYFISILFFAGLLLILDKYVFDETFFLTPFRAPIILLIFIAILRLLYKDSLSKIFASATIVFAINMIGSIISITLGLFIWRGNFFESKIISMATISSVFLTVFIMSILLFYMVRFLKKIPANVSQKHWRILALVELSVMIVCSQYIDHIKPIIEIQSILGLVLLLIIGVSSLMMFSSITEFYMKENKSLLLKIQNDALLTQLKAEEKQYANLKRFKHEMNSLLTSIYVLAENNEQKKITEIIVEKMDVLNVREDKVLTGNTLMDALLNLKIAEIHSLNIPLSTALAHLNTTLPFSPPDLCSIIMNIIENAIDASKIVMNQGGNPFIYMKICIYKNHLSIIVKNAYNGEIKIKGNELQTSKTESSMHGYGIKNTIQFISKYDGLFDYSYVDQVFNVKVMLPLNRN